MSQSRKNKKRPRRPSFEDDSDADSSDSEDLSMPASASRATNLLRGSEKRAAVEISSEDSGDDSGSGGSGSSSEEDAAASSSDGGSGAESGDDSGSDDDSDSSSSVDGGGGSAGVASLVPKGMTPVALPSVCTREDVAGPGKELWLFQVPRNFDASAISKRKLKFKLRRTTPGATVSVITPQQEGDKTYNINAAHPSGAAQLVNLFAKGKNGKLVPGKPFKRSFLITEDVFATSEATPFVLKDQRVPQVSNLNYVFEPMGHGSELNAEVAASLEEEKEKRLAAAAAKRAARASAAPATPSANPGAGKGAKSAKKSKKKKSKKSKKKKQRTQ